MSDSADWSLEEVEAIVSDYLAMLYLERRGEVYNKAEHNRNLRNLLSDRSRASIEWKHRNISAVLIELGHPYIEGYKPSFNYQDLLRFVVADRLGAARELEALVRNEVVEPAEFAAPPADLLSILTDPPDPRSGHRPGYFRETRHPELGGHRNYLEMEARNSSLGRAGEELVLEFEHRRLWVTGAKKLADKIEHVSKTRGDGLGFDILSFETNGRERLIEVKTTRYGSHIPFFASRNEVSVSEARHENFQLYRVFRFGKRTRLFTLQGSLSKTCGLDPVLFAATVR